MISINDQALEHILGLANDVGLHTLIKACETIIIHRRGYKDGRTAGTWVFDGNMTDESVEMFQQAIEDGDPQALDALPGPRLGGEFADDPKWEDILMDEGIRYDSEMDSDGRYDLVQEYELAFQSGVQDEVMSYGKHSTKA